MPEQIPDQYDLAGMERLSQIPAAQEEGIAVSSIPVYFSYQ
jgi:hypothetical protein